MIELYLPYLEGIASALAVVAIISELRPFRGKLYD